MEIKWNRLFLDDAKQKSSKVWPLPPWEEGAAFRSVQPLCQPLESASNQYPTLKSCFRALRRELSTRRDTLKTSLVQFALAAEQREADEAAAARAKAGQAPVPATIEQQNLTLWTKEEKDAYLARADLFFQCARVGAELSFGTFPVKQTCSASQTWPAILDHVCAVDKKRSCSIMSNNCRIDKTLMAFARLLVTLAGKTTASQQEVDRLGRCFSCLGCSPSFATTSRTFRQMVSCPLSRALGRSSLSLLPYLTDAAHGAPSGERCSKASGCGSFFSGVSGKVQDHLRARGSLHRSFASVSYLL